MTSLVAWVGADQRGPSSLNIATDSRISWGASAHWDFGRKSFASSKTPDIFGYIGQVEFPVIILAQVVDALDAGLITGTGDDAAIKFTAIQRFVEKSFLALPSAQQGSALLVYGTRECEGMRAEFRLWTLSLERGRVVPTSINVPASSSMLIIEGSGQDAVTRWRTRWESSRQGGTSRAVFSAFCDALAEGSDTLSGGSPQLVGLYRIGMGRTLGVVHQSRLWYNGAEVAKEAAVGCPAIEWRNRFFERCDSSGHRLGDAQAHHVPRGLGPSRE